MTRALYPIIHPTTSTRPCSNVMAGCDPNEMEESKEPVGALDGRFEYKKNKDGIINKHVVISTHCRKVITFHQSTSGFKYHLNAKHLFVGVFNLRCDPWPAADHSHRTQGIKKVYLWQIDWHNGKWIAKDCRQINIVEDTGCREVLKFAPLNVFCNPPSRCTGM